MFRLITFSRTRDPSVIDLFRYYSLAIQRYVPFEIREIKNIEKHKINSTILDKHKPAGITILLHEKGKQFDTPLFGKKIQEWQETGKDVNFFLGNAFGFEQEVLNTADSLLSLSPMTIQHDIAGIILLEQLYRVFNILHGGKYHKP